MKKYLAGLLIIPLLGLTTTAFSAAEIGQSLFFQQKDSEFTVYNGIVKLPSDGIWQIDSSFTYPDLVRSYLIPPDKVYDNYADGHRMESMRKKRTVNQGDDDMYQLFSACRDYAKIHGNIGPATLENLDKKEYENLFENLYRIPWNGAQTTESIHFLLPDVTFVFKANAAWVGEDRAERLAVELHPFVDDGKHWVLYTSGRTVRELIDPELIKKYGLKIKPFQTEPNEKPITFLYTILVELKNRTSGVLSIPIINPMTNEKIDIIWNTTDSTLDEKTVLDSLKKARHIKWYPYARVSDSTALWTWRYLNRDKASSESPPPQMESQENLTVFSLLGGRAAVEETLQMQLLNVKKNENESNSKQPESKEPILVENMRGVSVKPHPFADMLAKTLKNKPAPRLPLAEAVPYDRFFVGIQKPEALLPFLHGGVSFIADAGASYTGNALEYRLKEKYLQRLGLDAQWLESFLSSGAVTEMALFFPDLFFIDGTDMTVISRLNQPKLMGFLLKAAGINNLFENNMITRTLPDGGQVHWALQNDLLFISTSERELTASLKLLEDDGAESLGKSSEFQYMLTQLPASKSTRFYAYLSDPFIRRLVGPAVKIGQYRRMKARSDMEFLTSCMLLAKLNGISQPDSLNRLMEQRYAQKRFAQEDFTVDKNMMVHSKAYGNLQFMTPLSQIPVEQISQQEADAYEAYLENYENYWRHYFDPIAVRLNDTEDGALEATTFILPLVDNSIYNMLRDILKKWEDGIELKTPKIVPHPVVMFSMNLSEGSWMKILDDFFFEIFTNYADIDTRILDDLGPGIHLAIHDADPVIALGSGEIFGAFSGNMGRITEGFMFAPVLLSVLTRPCTLYIETSDPDRARQFLTRAATSLSSHRRGWVKSDFYQIEERDEWIFSIDLEGIVKFRYGIQIDRDFIIIRNIPWADNHIITQTQPALLNGAQLTAYPQACDIQVPALNTAAQEKKRDAALNGLGYLYPLIESGYATLENAAEKHAELFGFTPVHPGAGKWIWENGRLSSSEYGSPRHQKQPVAGGAVPKQGMLKNIEMLRINMQFEDAGLRTKMRWKISR